MPQGACQVHVRARPVLRVYGPTHVLVWNGPDGDPEYEVEHPPECPIIDKGGYEDYNCGVAFELDNVGLGDLVDLVDMEYGRYQFRHWTERIRHAEGSEWTAGFELISDA